MSLKLATFNAGKLNLPAFNFQSGSANTALGIFAGAFVRIPASFPNQASTGSYLWGNDPDNNGTYDDGNDHGTLFWGPSVGGAASQLSAYAKITGTELWDFSTDRNWSAAGAIAAGDYLYIEGIVDVGSTTRKHFKALIPVNGNSASAKTFVGATTVPSGWAGLTWQFVDRIFNTGTNNKTEVGFAFEHFAIMEGKFPLVSGAPDPAWLVNLASGAKNWIDLKTAIGGDLRCWYQITGAVADLTDVSGSGRSALTVSGTLQNDTAIAPAGFSPTVTLTDVTLRDPYGDATTTLYCREPSGMPLATISAAAGAASFTVGGTLTGAVLFVSGSKLYGSIPDGATGTITITQTDATANNSPRTTTFTVGSGLTLLPRGARPNDGTAIGGMPTKHFRKYSTAIAAFRAVEFKYAGQTLATDTTAATIAALQTNLGNRTVNQWHRITLTGAASAYAGTIVIPDRDMGTGGVIVDMSGLQLPSVFTMGHYSGISFRNGTFVGPGTGNGNASATIFDAQATPAVGAGVRGRRVRFEGSCKIGYLHVAGATVANDWKKFPSFITCFHGEQIVFESGIDINGVNGLAGLAAVDHVYVGAVDIKEYRNSLWTIAEAYYLGETQLPTVNGTLNYFFERETLRRQFDRMDLLSTATPTPINSADHTDHLQFNPGDAQLFSAFVAGTRKFVGYKTFNAGKIYKLTAQPGAGNAATAPTHSSGSVSVDGGFQWQFIANDAPIELNAFIIEPTVAERGTTVATDNSHGQTAALRDSSANFGRLTATGVTVFAGAIYAASTAAGLESGSVRKVWASQSVFAGPPDTSIVNDPNVVIDSAVVSAGTGDLETFRCIYGNAYAAAGFGGVMGTGRIAEIDKQKVGFNAGTSAPNLPATKFRGSFSQKSPNNSWIFPAVDVHNSSLSQAAFRKKMETQFRSQAGILAGFIRQLLAIIRSAWLNLGLGF